jgi:hypothetical protein
MKKHFFWQKWRTYQYQLGVHRDAERGYWGCMPAYFCKHDIFVLGKQPGASFAMSKLVQRMRHAAWSASQSTRAVSYV